MPPVLAFVDTAFRLYVLAELTARYLSLCALVVGIIGYWTAGANTRRSTRFRGMVVESCAALVAAFGLGAFYDLVEYVVAGSNFLLPEWPYGAGGAGDLLSLAQAASGMLSSLGSACFSLGAAFWGAGSPTIQARRRGYRGVLYGLTMIGVPMRGPLFTVFVTVFTTL